MHNSIKAIVSASVLLCASFAVSGPAAAAVDVNYNLPSENEIQERKDNRRNMAVSERVGRRIMGAFESYEEDDLAGAIEELEDVSGGDDFDKAYVARYLGAFYASADRLEEARRLLKQAIQPDILGWSDHEQSIKLLADISLQVEDYEDALRYYGQWLQFTGEADAETFFRIANAYYELGEFEEVIEPAELAVEYYDEPNKNPYVLQVASYYERDMYSEAIDVLEAGLAVLPGEKNWWVQLANFYMLEEQIEKGLETIEIAYLAGYLDSENHFKILVQLYANNLIPYKSAMLMDRFIEEGKIEETERNARSAASNYEAAKEYESAAEWYAKAAGLAESQQERAANYRRQGVALIRAEQYNSATQAFQRALDNDVEGKGAIYMSMAEAFYYTDRLKQALDAATEASNYDKERRNARSWIGYIRSKAERNGISL